MKNQLSKSNRNFVTVDTETGEPVEGFTVWIPRQKTIFKNENWIVMFQQSLMKISRLDLSKSTFKVYNVLLAQAEFDNYVKICQQEIADFLGINQALVSLALKELRENKIILKGKSGAYKLNSHLCWKGDSKNLMKIRLEQEENKI